MKKLHFCYISNSCTTSHKPFWIHQYLYFHEMYKTIVGTWQKFAVSFLQDIKNGISNSYFVNIKAFRLQASNLLDSRKACILDVMCKRFCFGEVQEEVLGQCTGQGIFQHPEQKVYLSISDLFQKKNEQSG